MWGRVREREIYFHLWLLMGRESLIPLWCCCFWMYVTHGFPACWYSTSMVKPSWRNFYLHWTCQPFRLPQNLHDLSHEGVNTTGVFCDILWVSHGFGMSCIHFSLAYHSIFSSHMACSSNSSVFIILQTIIEHQSLLSRMLLTSGLHRWTHQALLTRWPC